MHFFKRLVQIQRALQSSFFSPIKVCDNHSFVFQKYNVLLNLLNHVNDEFCRTFSNCLLTVKLNETNRSDLQLLLNMPL